MYTSFAGVATFSAPGLLRSSQAQKIIIRQG